jgi:mlo protein
LQLLLLIGTKLEHIITQLAYEVATKHTAVEGDIAVSPSDNLFWFHSPRLVLALLHFILFQNAFEFAYFIWTMVSVKQNVLPPSHFKRSCRLLCLTFNCPFYLKNL